MPLRNVRYRVVHRGGKEIRLAINKTTGKVVEVKVIGPHKGKAKRIKR